MLRCVLKCLSRKTPGGLRSLEQALAAEAERKGCRGGSRIEELAHPLSISPDHHHPLPSVVLEDAGDFAGNHFSLSKFFNEMKRLNKAFREMQSIESRRALHAEIDLCWKSNVDLAVKHLTSPRDIGFLALFGLSSKGLRVSRAQLQSMCRHLIGVEAVHLLPYDCCVALHYFGREVCAEYTSMHKENQELSETRGCRASGHDRGGAGQSTPTPVSDDLVNFLTEFGSEKLTYFFVPAGRRKWVIGSGRDAIEALEFIASMLRVHQLSSGSSSTTLVKLVPSVFAVAVSDVTSIRVTDTVRLFSLLRIFRRILSPAQCSSTARTLVRGVRYHDSHVLNPHHIIKIVITLQRMPVRYFTGGGRRSSAEKQPIVEKSKEVLNENIQQSSALQVPQPSSSPLDGSHDALGSEALWEYVVSKVCLVYGSMSDRERRIVFDALRDTLRRRGMKRLLAPIENERLLGRQSGSK
jgi:hypothetical protein